MIEDSLHSCIVLPTAARSRTFSPWPPFLPSLRSTLNFSIQNQRIMVESVNHYEEKKSSSHTLKEMLVNLSGKKKEFRTPTDLSTYF